MQDGIQTIEERGFRYADAVSQLARVILEQGFRVLTLPVGIVD